MLAQTLFNGTITGSTYATFAVGFTLIFGIHRILNLAHGFVFTWGAIAALYLVVDWGLSWPAGIVAGALFAGIITVLMDFLVFQPLDRRKAPESAGLIASIGVGLILQSLAQKATDTDVLRFPQHVTPNSVWRVGGVYISSLQLTMLLVAIAMTAALAYFLNRTRQGVFTRAVAENPDTSRLVGVNPRSVRFTTFLIGGAFAGISGVLIGTAYNTVHFMMGEPFLLIGMAAVALGGMGSVTGAFLGGMALGMAREITVAYVSTELSDALPFIVLFLILILRPQGLLGTSKTVAVIRAGRL